MPADDATAPGSSVVLVTFPDYPQDDSTLCRRLRRAGLTVRRAPKLGARSPEEVVEHASGCVAVIASTDPFTADVFEGLPGLRVVARVGIGYDTVDLQAAARRGVIVTAARGTNEEAVADHTVGLMLTTLRRTVVLDDSVRRGSWDRTGTSVGADLHGKTVGLVGLGAIASLVAKRLTGFDVRLLGHDPAVSSHPTVAWVTLAELLRRSDVVSVHVPLFAGTRNLIDGTALATMKPGAVLVNTSRGGVVDEAGLAEALASGRLAAAGIDVFAEEPPTDSPLLAFKDRTVLTPHIAGLSRESIAAMMRHATDSVVDALGGRRPAHVVNPDVYRHLSAQLTRQGTEPDHG